MAFIRDGISKLKDLTGKSADQTPFVASEEVNSGDEADGKDVVEGAHSNHETKHQPKPWHQLARLSGTVCGIEFCYAAETAFVSPILLRIGIAQRFMTMVWCLSPLMGFLWMPILGSASDRCGSRLGRRRPFILLLSVGIILGLILVPNGYRLGSAICGLEVVNSTNSTSCEGTPSQTDTFEPSVDYQTSESISYDTTDFDDNETTTMMYIATSEIPGCQLIPSIAGHTCGIILTVIGIVLLDFNCDACQSPARAYLIDVTHPADHVRGLSMFSFMAGLGGSIGYMIGGIPWHETTGDDIVGAQIRFVFGLVLIIFVIALVLTVTAEKEKTLAELFPEERKGKKKKKKPADDHEEEEMELGILSPQKTYGTDPKNTADHGSQQQNGGTNQTADGDGPQRGPTEIGNDEENKNGKQVELKKNDDRENEEMREETQKSEENEVVTMRTYLMSIVRMPWSVRVLCCTHLLGWMSLLCYSLYFTDFVGQAVYGGDPYAAPGTPERYAYAKGVRMGSYAMGLYSITCALCSFTLERMMAKVGAKTIYVCNHLVYSCCMACLALIRTNWAIFVFSASAGVQYSTLFTLPFILLARYHSTDTFSKSKEGYEDIVGEAAEHSRPKHGNQIRGLGTDVAIVQSMVFVAQFCLSLCMGSIVQAVGSTVAVVVSACILSFLGSLMATQVLYAGL